MDDVELQILACPRDGASLRVELSSLACPHGHRYPLIEGLPVLMPEEVVPTLPAQAESLRRAHGRTAGDPRAPELHLESLGINDLEKEGIVRLWNAGDRQIDPVVRFLVGATCGMGYSRAGMALDRYPIPPFPELPGNGRLCVDVGCNWGRWSLSAASAGYRVVGVDPQLGAVLAASRVARQLSSGARFVCGDARMLPFATGSVDFVFSYSVLQHFSPEDLVTSLSEIGRILRPSGVALVQMANALGLRSTYHRARRGRRPPREFDVRYYWPGKLLELFANGVGPARLDADCFFGLGLQSTDARIVSLSARAAMAGSEVAKRVAKLLPPLARLADSVYIRAVRR